MNLWHTKIRCACIVVPSKQHKAKIRVFEFSSSWAKMIAEDWRGYRTKKGKPLLNFPEFCVLHRRSIKWKCQHVQTGEVSSQSHVASTQCCRWDRMFMPGCSDPTARKNRRPKWAWMPTLVCVNFLDGQKPKSSARGLRMIPDLSIAARGRLRAPGLVDDLGWDQFGWFGLVDPGPSGVRLIAFGATGPGPAGSLGQPFGFSSVIFEKNSIIFEKFSIIFVRSIFNFRSIFSKQVCFFAIVFFSNSRFKIDHFFSIFLFSIVQKNSGKFLKLFWKLSTKIKKILYEN
jgi:hypothetical protein